MFTIRRGRSNDFEELTRLRIDFLMEAGNLKDKSQAAEVREALMEYFQKEMDKSFFCWVAVAEDRIVGTSGLVINRKPPSYGSLSGSSGYIMNMYTVPDYRKKGIASLLIKEILEYLKAESISYVYLNATGAGKPVYEKLGFKVRENEMVLQIDRT